MEEGEEVDIKDKPELKKGETQPPARYSQGKLIEKMEDLGLGTKSTRHSIIESLYQRGYIYADPITPTETGTAVTEALRKFAGVISSPDMTSALEKDMDAIADGKDAFVPAVMEHIEEAGVHSGDSACVIPPVSIPQKHIDTIRDYTSKIAVELNAVGLMNIQYAIHDDTVYVLEANPRASRTVPLVSKVCGLSMARSATEILLAQEMKWRRSDKGTRRMGPRLCDLRQHARFLLCQERRPRLLAQVGETMAAMS